MPPVSDQEWLKAKNQVLDNLQHLVERFNNRLTLDNPRLIERYVKGELQMLIHFFVAGHPSEEYVAHLRSAASSRGSEERPLQIDPRGHIGVTRLCEQLPHRISDEDTMVSDEVSKDSPVLIHDIQTVEHPQQRIPTLARVDRMERFYDFWPEGLYWSEGFGFRSLGVVVNRKLNFAPIVTGVFPANEEKLVSEVVKRGSERVDDLADQCTTEGSERLNLAQIKDRLASLRVWLSADTVCAIFGPCPHIRFEITALFLGPFNAL